MFTSEMLQVILSQRRCLLVEQELAHGLFPGNGLAGWEDGKKRVGGKFVCTVEAPFTDKRLQVSMNCQRLSRRCIRSEKADDRI